MDMQEDEKDLHINRYKGSKSRFDLVINNDNLSLYENYIKKISMMNSKFPNFFVENLKDYNNYPLESFDVDFDKSRDIEYYIRQNP